jgi:STAS domain
MAAVPAKPIVCNVGVLAPDVTTVDALARLRLTARRLGRELRLHGATQELEELLVFLGLDDVLRLEPRGQPEEREDRLGVEEERELDDPAL